ncbi:hypothetical protein CVS42_10980 [Aeromonas veronii]|uniref:hypothetical protein n=1 Tax=Aeromonas veronii TaxID=654 RepID=UPI000C2876B6|nr:hypothetical protein [Aeromonas veronii]ATY81302.1 hypothetical protein CVS42_10980 [Aeromonas veronii]
MANEHTELLLKHENNQLKQQVYGLESRAYQKENSLNINKLKIEGALLKQRLEQIEQSIAELKKDSKKSEDDIQTLQAGVAEAKATSATIKDSQAAFQVSYTDIYQSSLYGYSFILTLLLGLTALGGYLFINKIRRQEVKDVCDDVKVHLKEDREINSLVVTALSDSSVTEKFDVMIAQMMQKLQEDIKNEIRDKLSATAAPNEPQQPIAQGNELGQENDEVKQAEDHANILHDVIDTGDSK